jgi:hypothetical protein
VDRHPGHPEERREEKHRSDRSPSEWSPEGSSGEGSPSEATNEGREGDRRRGPQLPPAAGTTPQPSEASSLWEEPYPHEEERLPHHLERTWWRRILRAPRVASSERRWWEFWR